MKKIEKGYYKIIVTKADGHSRTFQRYAENHKEIIRMISEEYGDWKKIRIVQL